MARKDVQVEGSAGINGWDQGVISPGYNPLTYMGLYWGSAHVSRDKDGCTTRTCV